MRRNKPEIIEVDDPKLEAVLSRAERALDAEDYRLLRAFAESYAYITDLVDDKHTTIARLRKLLFGDRTEKTKDVLGDHHASPGEKASAEAAGEAKPDSPTGENGSLRAERKGHGRNAADAYPGAKQIDVTHESLTAGDACPDCLPRRLRPPTTSASAPLKEIQACRKDARLAAVDLPRHARQPLPVLAQVVDRRTQA